MPYSMKRARQKLSADEAFAILKSGREGVLSIIDVEGKPYGVPMNYVLCDEKIYMHGSLSGRRADAIKGNKSASFCVILEGEIIPKEFATRYISVIVDGKISIVEDDAERQEALMALAKTSDHDEIACQKEIDRFIEHCTVMRLDIESLSGKESKDLANGHKG